MSSRLTAVFAVFAMLFASLAAIAAEAESAEAVSGAAQEEQAPPEGAIPYDDLAGTTRGPSAPYVIGPGSWDHTHITYWIGNLTTDMTGAYARQAIRDAFAIWSTAGTRLTFDEISDPYSADIWIEWATWDHGDGQNFDGLNGTLAHTFFPPSGIVHFDDSEHWTTGTRGSSDQPIDLVTVAAHELGHALGLDHPASSSALMYAYYNGSHRYLAADDIAGIQALYPAPQTASSKFVAVTPTRVLDTRNGTGGSYGRVDGGDWIQLQVGGVAPVPANATAAVLNVTVTEPTGPTWVTVYPATVPRPWVSNLNVNTFQTMANLVTTQLGSDGAIRLYNAAVKVHLVADVVGYYIADGTGHGFTPVAPARLMDTRDGTGTGEVAPIGSGGEVSLKVTGTGGVPADASAVIVNVTATDATSPTYVTAYPAGQSRPTASTINLVPNQVMANLASLMVGTGGNVKFYNAAGAVHVVVDVVGYYRGSGGASFVAITPLRLFDTRLTQTPVGPGGVLQEVAAGTPSIPADASAILASTAATQASTGSYLTVYPGGATPFASNLNFGPGTTVPNLVATGLQSGSFSVYNALGTVHVFADVAGYFR